MNTLRKVLVVAFVFAAFLAGCSSTSSPTTASTDEPVSIKLSTIPEDPQAGNIELVFSLQDSTAKKPIPGADVDVIADHTEMGGMTMHGKATEQENGQYSIKANFGMSGIWKLTVQVKKGDLDYKKDFEIKVK